MALRRALPLVGYLLLMVGVIGAFAVLVYQRQESRRGLCEAILDDRGSLADVINNFVPPVRPVDPTLSPDLQRVIAKSQRNTQRALDRTQARLSRPIPFCRAAGIDTSVTVHGATPLPVQVTGVPGTTTTTTTPSGQGLRSTTRTTRRAGSRPTPTTRPGGSSSTPPPGPSSPTTTRCRVRVPTDGCLP